MARTLLGDLGHATLNFFVVAARLFLAFCVCPKFCNLAKQQRKRFWGVSEVGGPASGRGAYSRDSVVVVEGTGPASRVGSVLGFLGGGVYACVFVLLVGAVCRVEGSEPGGGVMEGGVRKVAPVAHVYRVVAAVPSACMVYCSLCPWSVMWTLGAGGSYTWVFRVRGAGDIDLGGFLLASSGVWHDVLGCPLVVGGFLWVEWVWRWGFVLGLRVRRGYGCGSCLYACFMTCVVVRCSFLRVALSLWRPPSQHTWFPHLRLCSRGNVGCMGS